MANTKRVHAEVDGEAACNIEHRSRLRVTDDLERVNCGLCQRIIEAKRLGQDVFSMKLDKPHL